MAREKETKAFLDMQVQMKHERKVIEKESEQRHAAIVK